MTETPVTDKSQGENVGKLKDLLVNTQDENTVPIRTFVLDGNDIGIAGQVLVTVYADSVTVATRHRISDRWSAPVQMEEVR